MLKILQSPKNQTPFAPYWQAQLFETNINTNETCDKIAEIVLEKEVEIIEQFKNVQNDGGTGLSKDSLTSKFSAYNIFDWKHPEICFMKDFFVQQYNNFMKSLNLLPENCYIQCWANVLRKNEKIEPHWHSSSSETYLSGHFVVKSFNTQTLYQNPYMPSEWIPFENEKGNLLFFPSWMVHSTTPVTDSDPRITIAFDLIPERFFNFQDNTKKYLKFNF